MYIQQLYTNCLAQAAYYIESEGEAVIVDPLRDVQTYIDLAASRNAKIRFSLQTHFHADFVSGHLELARKTGAVIVYGPGAQPDYAAAVLKDYDVLDIGKVKIMILHTPGHTIESTCFLLFDEENNVHSIFSGDTLFIGDVGRPDLLSGNLDAETLGGMLFDSLQNKIKVLPDDCIVYPGHGAGSACGKNLGKETTSTIGIQKATNYALQFTDKQAFIDAVIAEQPAAPAYFFKDARINIHGYESLDKVMDAAMKGIDAATVQLETAEGALILDTRPAAVFAKGFIPGSLNIGLNGEFAVWAGTLVDISTPLILISEEGKEKEAVTRLARIGYENILGYLEGGFASWKSEKLPTSTIKNVSVDDFANLMDSGKYALLDVRKPGEVEKNKVFEAHHISLNKLAAEMDTLDPKNKYIVYCGGGYRSMMACTMMLRAGIKHVVNVAGGINAILKEKPDLVQYFELV
ncbi:MAG TPA: MBL fold metallo-hydrolase [Chitinophagales bacterium]|nr:MBL fold metallo-hydrolase [Chitinophagales bacterium]HMX03730.1 MBL fold metallo-hydrolase [Chitinophagales bacterium]HNA56980.1 MBL fold metallo-hydrolase [Chitinophagales bacterium]HNF69341.1 MBL fold metallo-hydrolase [Chitinophagales bacterium]HNK97539.1 MBL fold metallo-hydrolase [Chitinophagales bacterium]